MTERADPATSERLRSQLVDRLLAPLVLGGELRPLPPFGARRASALAPSMHMGDGDSSERLARARLALARSLFPVDALPEPSVELWLLIFAFNDLLQVTHPELNRAFARNPQQRLLSAIESTVARAGAPGTVAETLARHSVFARVFDMVRVDEHVSWWSGSQSFLGTRAPARLTAWPRLRRVEQRRESVALVDLSPAAAWAPRWLETLARWLRASPLTDLGTASRKAPRFVWSGTALGLVETAPGRVLAIRAIDREGESASAVDALRQAAQGIEPDAARRRASEFADELEQTQDLYKSAL
jgi:hypothetical protein